MSSKSTSRSASSKKDSGLRSSSKALAVLKGKNSNNSKHAASHKACNCILKSESWKNSRLSQNSKAPAKKITKSVAKDGKKGTIDRREKVVIVSKRSSSVSVVKSCNLRKSVSVRKVSYSTSFVVSSDEDSDSEEEEDDDESDYEERSTSRKKTVIKRTTSKVKSNFTNKKSARAAKKAKAIKLLCDKLSSKKSNERELRPRFPYNMLQEWPAARTHRMASLNALAKVHVLYENEGRTTGENLKDADETSLIDFLNEENSEEESEDGSDAKSPPEKKTDKQKNLESTKKKTKPVRRGRKRKASDVEIIDTRLCKRMASLNAQAILAASYVAEPKQKKPLPTKKAEKQNRACDMDLKVILESKCDLEIIETNKKSIKSDSSNSSDIKLSKISPPEIHLTDSKNSDSTDIVGVMSPDSMHHSWRLDPDMPFGKSIQSETPLSNSSNIISSSASTKVGVTQYSEVTKVHINSSKDLEVKEEKSPSRKMERFLANDDVAITQMYHYQSKNSNESYCVQMKTTYRPGSRNLSPAIPISPPSSMHPHMADPLFHGRPSYYGHSPMLPGPPYHMNPAVGGMHYGLDHRIPHQYGGSAFAMPHYRHPQPMPYHHGDYGYYQPAGPLIQPHHEQYTIHKPVPYHPPPPLHPQPVQAPHQPPNTHRDAYGSYDPLRSHSKVPPLPQSHPNPPVHKPNSVKSLSPNVPESPRTLPYSMPYKHQGEKLPPEKLSKNPAAYNLSPKSMSPSSLQPSYPSQNSYRDYPRPRPPGPAESYPRSYGSASPPYYSGYRAPPMQDLPCHQSRHSSHTGYDYKDPRQHENLASNQLPSKMSSPSRYPGSSMESHSSYPVTDIKEPGWNIKANPEDGSDVPVAYIPYPVEPRKDHPAREELEPTSYPPRPPSVIEIVEENSRDTKTYIQLEVPRNSYREKIVVIDVEKEELSKKAEIESKQELKETGTESSVQSLHSQDAEPPTESLVEEKTDLPLSKVEEITSAPSNSEESETKPVDQSKESQDVMILEVKKKKESAVVRRARLHGKQRTFRDAYNRPLVPLSKVKKTEASTAGSVVKKSAAVELPSPLPPAPKTPERKFAHGWSWEGKSFHKQVYVSNDESPCVRTCYSAIKHVEGDVICVRDCVLLRSGPKKTDLPFVAKITALWDNPADGEMIMSLMWYYRPEHTETGKKFHHMEDEIFASKHKDTNSVACIEDKCYVLTYSEYCRFKKRCRMFDQSATPNPTSIVPQIQVYPRTNRLPPINVSPDLVFFCRKVYDFRQKRLLKNPV